MAQLSNRPEWNYVVEWFEAMLKEQDKENRVLLDQKLYQGQGTAQVMAYILDNIAESKKTARSLQNRGSSQ